MYCPNCGNSVNKKLKYCNNCGEQLVRDDDKDGTPGKMLDNVLTTLFLVVMFGMGILVGLVAVLLTNNVPTQVVTVVDRRRDHRPRTILHRPPRAGILINLDHIPESARRRIRFRARINGRRASP